ncbi:Glutamate synthase [NADPH] large chain [hydrothermal vent metagenome]|uniref:Glutamate synthase [NADPH] large chain n=1 Tax=hydrothermal vent metagenome TaxID=652676 RepID=A0A3B1CEI7_9ZZZZ
MTEPDMPGKTPAMAQLKAGTHYWCACGKSKSQPFCDGAHQGTDFSPLEFTLEEDKEVALCNCKRTKNPPYCDGTHQSL